MIEEREIRQRLVDLLYDQLGLEEFEDWLVQRSWNMHQDSSAGAQSLVSAIELALAEHSSGHLSRKDLFAQLLSFLSQIRIGGPSVALASSNFLRLRRPLSI
jgi:hypothetical protein